MKIYYNPKLKTLARRLRNDSTLPEVLLWNELKGRRMMGYQFMRQKPIDNYIVDFFCSKLRLVIEVDGSSHNHRYKEDQVRQKKLEGLGLNFFRFDNPEVKKEMANVLRTIQYYIEGFENSDL